MDGHVEKKKPSFYQESGKWKMMEERSLDIDPIYFANAKLREMNMVVLLEDIKNQVKGHNGYLSYGSHPEMGPCWRWFLFSNGKSLEGETKAEVHTLR